MKITRWILGAVGTIAVLAFVEFGLGFTIDYLFHPWAYRVPTLLGTWSGVLSHPRGGQFRVLLDLQHDPGIGSRQDDSQQIEGSSAVCAQGQRFDGGLGGKVRWSGHEFELSFRATFGENGVPETVDCHWEPDVLTCRFDFSKRYRDPRIQAILKKDGRQTEWPPVPVAFKRTTAAAFAATCKATP